MWLTGEGGPFSEEPPEEGLDVEKCGFQVVLHVV